MFFMSLCEENYIKGYVPICIEQSQATTKPRIEGLEIEYVDGANFKVKKGRCLAKDGSTELIIREDIITAFDHEVFISCPFYKRILGVCITLTPSGIKQSYSFDDTAWRNDLHSSSNNEKVIAILPVYHYTYRHADTEIVPFTTATYGTKLFLDFHDFDREKRKMNQISLIWSNLVTHTSLFCSVLERIYLEVELNFELIGNTKTAYLFLAGGYTPSQRFEILPGATKATRVKYLYEASKFMEETQKMNGLRVYFNVDPVDRAKVKHETSYFYQTRYGIEL